MKRPMLIITIICLAIIALCHIYGISNRIYLDSINIATVNRESDIYRYWESLGLKNRVIVYLSRTLNFITFDEVNHMNIRRDFPVLTPDISRLYKDSLGDENFLFISVKTGIGRRIYHIIPEEDIIGRIKDAQGLTFYDVKGNMPIIVKGMVIMTWYRDIERFIMTLKHINTITIREPVILAVHPSFFDSNETPDRVFEIIKGSLKVDSIVFCVPEGYTPNGAIEKIERLKWLIQKQNGL